MATTHSSENKHSTSDHAKGAQKGESSAAGEKHVSQAQVGSGKEHDPNNFANNKERAAAAGHKGGQHSHDKD